MERKILNKQFKVDIKDIQLIVYDFDGVFTNNKVLVFEDGKEAVFCNRADGLAIQKIKGLGISQMILSTEANPLVKARAKKLNLPVIHNLKDKKRTLLEYCNKHNYNLKNILYVGNDINDLEAMKLAGHSVAPSDASFQIKKIAKIITRAKGGEGVIRELFDILSCEKNKAIFITVRTGSTRLPKKTLLEIQGKKTIEYLIERVKHSELKDLIVLCTTKRKADNILCKIASRHGIEFYRGSVKDKLMRWFETTKAYNVEFFVTADGDDLFCEPELIDLAFRQYRKSRADFIEARDIPCGAFTYGIKTNALRKVCEIKGTSDTEMMWTYFKDTKLFKVEQLKNVPEIYKRPEIRMTLDYPEDFQFFETIITELGKRKKYFNLKSILSYLDKNPEVIKINQHLQKEFLENQKRKTHLVLKRRKYETT